MDYNRVLVESFNGLTAGNVAHLAESLGINVTAAEKQSGRNSILRKIVHFAHGNVGVSECIPFLNSVRKRVSEVWYGPFAPKRRVFLSEGDKDDILIDIQGATVNFTDNKTAENESGRGCHTVSNGILEVGGHKYTSEDFAYADHYFKAGEAGKQEGVKFREAAGGEPARPELPPRQDSQGESGPTDSTILALGALLEPAIRPIVHKSLGEIGDKMNALEKAIEMARKVVNVIKIADSEKEIKRDLHSDAKGVAELVANNINVMLVGPAGCGKSVLGADVAEMLGIGYAAISCSNGMSEGQLLGYLLPTGNDGKFEYNRSVFIDKYENGGLILLDEIDAADPNTLTVINNAIANDRIFVPTRFDNPEVKRHKDFRVIAAANTFGTGADAMYVGRNQLDAATLDRFEVIYMDYDPKLEEKLIDPNLLAWARGMRKAISSKKIRRVVSTRKLITYTTLMRAGIVKDSTAAAKRFTQNWTDNEKSALGIK